MISTANYHFEMVENLPQVILAFGDPPLLMINMPDKRCRDLGFGFERHARAIAVQRGDMRPVRKIRHSASGELGIEFDPRHPPRDPDQLR
jgi:hypothetical protein